MPAQIKDNIELICMLLTIMTAVSVVAYKSHDIDDLKASQIEIRQQIKQDHDTLTKMATDVSWIRKQMDNR